jgi:DNA-directed RNA polymerase specialized sigma24 family protein
MENLAELAALVQEGDEAAYGRLYDTLYSRIYNFVSRRLIETGAAERIVSEALHRFFGSLTQFRNSEELLLHAFRITKARLSANETACDRRRAIA